jgi:hypothetical protein
LHALNIGLPCTELCSGTLLAPLAAVSCLTHLGLFLRNLQRTTFHC